MCAQIREEVRAHQGQPDLSKSGLKRSEQKCSHPAHLVAEITACVALTILNPLTILYWVGVTSNWLPFAHSVLGYSAPGWGILMTGAGLMSWFTAVIIVVRFIPHRIGPTFFRLVNAILGLILLGFATLCGIVLSRHFPH